MATHRIRYVESAQCDHCNSMVRSVTQWGELNKHPDYALCECYSCEVQFKVPVRYIECEIVSPANQSDKD